MFVSMWVIFFSFFHILLCACYFGGRQLPPETSIRMRPPYTPFSPHSSRVRTEQLWWFHLHTNNQPGLRQPPSVWLLLSLTSPAVQQEWRSHASVINCLEPREWRRAGVTQLGGKKNKKKTWLHGCSWEIWSSFNSCVQSYISESVCVLHCISLCWRHVPIICYMIYHAMAG